MGEAPKNYYQRNKKKMRAYHKKWQAKNKARWQAIRHTYYLKHKKKLNATSKAWAQKNAEKMRAYIRKYARKNKTKIALYAKAYRIMNYVYAPKDPLYGTRIVKSMRGKGNPRWNGGRSQYKNHYIFKIQRKKKLALTNNCCESCGGRAKVVHHINKCKEDHRLENLMCLCRRCHTTIHYGTPSEIKQRQRERALRYYYRKKKLALTLDK